MATYKITGKVIHIGGVEVIGAKKFEKRTLAIEVTDGKYSEQIPFEASGKTMDLLNHLRDGDEIEVVFAVKGREWQGRYFASLRLVGINSEEVQDRATNGGSSKAKASEKAREQKWEAEHQYEDGEIDF